MPNLDYLSGISPNAPSSERPLSNYYTIEGGDAVQLYEEEVDSQPWVVDKNGLFYDMVADPNVYGSTPAPKLMGPADQGYMSKLLFGVDPSDRGDSGAASAAASLAESKRQFDISRTTLTATEKAQLEADKIADLRREVNDL